MAKSDLNHLAASIVPLSTGGDVPAVVKEKNPAAVLLGRAGGLKGGRARAEALSPEQRKAIAKRAAHSRWSKGR